MLERLSRREREILEILYQKTRATAQDVQSAMSDSPSYSAVRAFLRILEEKGHIRHDEEGARYVYSPVVARNKARKAALKSVVSTFFEGSVENVVAALVDGEAARLSRPELDRIARMIERARKDLP